MEIYLKTNGSGEIIKDPFHSMCLSWTCWHDNYCVIRILNNRVIKLSMSFKGQADLPLSECIINGSLEEIRCNNEDEGGQGVSLPNTTFAVELSAWNTI